MPRKPVKSAPPGDPCGSQNRNSMSTLTLSPAWQALTAHQRAMAGTSIAQLVCRRSTALREFLAAAGRAAARLFQEPDQCGDDEFARGARARARRRRRNTAPAHRREDQYQREPARPAHCAAQRPPADRRRRRRAAAGSGHARAHARIQRRRARRPHHRPRRRKIHGRDQRRHRRLAPGPGARDACAGAVCSRRLARAFRVERRRCGIAAHACPARCRDDAGHRRVENVHDDRNADRCAPGARLAERRRWAMPWTGISSR